MEFTIEHPPTIFRDKQPHVLNKILHDDIFAACALACSAEFQRQTIIKNVPLLPESETIITAFENTGVVKVHRKEQNSIEYTSPLSVDVQISKAITDLTLTTKKTVQLGENPLAARLLLGNFLTGYSGEIVLEGEGLLSRRSFARIVEPLTEIGAEIAPTLKQTLPIVIFGQKKLRSFNYDFPHPNFYVKACLLLAALKANGVSQIEEPAQSITHIEDLLSGIILRKDTADRTLLEIHPDFDTQNPPFPEAISVPKDEETTSFVLLCAIAQKKSISLSSVIISGGRASLAEFINEFVINGCSLQHEKWGIGSIHLSDNVEFPSVIFLNGQKAKYYKNSFPFIAVLAALCGFELVYTDALDIRQRTCDWIAATVDALASFGIEVDELDDGIHVYSHTPLSAGAAECYFEETLSCAFLALGCRFGDSTFYSLPSSKRIETIVSLLR